MQQKKGLDFTAFVCVMSFPHLPQITMVTALTVCVYVCVDIGYDECSVVLRVHPRGHDQTTGKNPLLDCVSCFQKKRHPS